jgi:hypothetical protein
MPSWDDIRCYREVGYNHHVAVSTSDAHGTSDLDANPHAPRPSPQALLATVLSLMFPRCVDYDRLTEHGTIVSPPPLRVRVSGRHQECEPIEYPPWKAQWADAME